MEITRLTTRRTILDCIDRWNAIHPSVPFARRLAAQRIFMPAPGVSATVWGVVPESGDAPVGFAITKHLSRPVPGYEDATTGWLSLFTLDPVACDVADDGADLLETALSHLRDRGVTTVILGSDIRKFMPALPRPVHDHYTDLLEAVDFEAGGTVADLYCDLRAPGTDERLSEHRSLSASVDVGPVEPATEPALHDFMAREFPGRWQFQVEANCTHPGGVDDYWVVRDEGEVVAFARTGTADSPVLSACLNWVEKWGPRTCGLGPIGVAESRRREGHGLLLIANVMAAFRERGYQHMVIDGVADGLRGYYAQLGFEPAIEFVSYRATL
ncbi:GNAT family N-acetyltransferase [Haladaptatus sp. DYSN1]|uniref:GNAT family N-acetyltransferase n=1 Tax=unclassified Haladaptatus TaxID=2622732 RepID=UPI0024067152|nr:GNAT family N-acetyltransferase [Haladaptatus sp. DYSN1]